VTNKLNTKLTQMSTVCRGDWGLQVKPKPSGVLPEGFIALHLKISDNK
jgi:hypothetical protein